MAQNVGIPANVPEPAVAATDLMSPPAVVTDASAPVPVIDSAKVAALGLELFKRFEKYKNDRRLAEIRWLQNQRQYLGEYDDEVKEKMSTMRSMAYPRVTRVKVITALAKIMNLMFPGNDRNWDLTASPTAEMDPEDVSKAVNDYVQKLAEANPEIMQGNGPQLTDDDIEAAVQAYADKMAERMKKRIDDQLQELGGNQDYDYVALNRQMLKSGLIYGPGFLVGPFVDEVTKVSWGLDPMTGQPAPNTSTIFKPVFEWLSIWDFYGDMSAKTLDGMDGWFRRLVMSRDQVRRLADRAGFFSDIIKKYLRDHSMGNYKPLLHETQLRVMGIKAHTNDQSPDGSKYEVLVYNGFIAATTLRDLGLDVPEDKLGDDIEAEVWMIENYVIKADINPWRKLGVEMKTLHWFLFDEDDTSPLGSGLPNVIRDSQMAICNATRMLMDNASVVCGPNIEVNTKLMAPDMDVTSVAAYKVWKRIDDDPATAQYPAVREIKFDSHISELTSIIQLFMDFADKESFIEPMGDRNNPMPSEPMRTAAGASMIKGERSLTFKDIIRAFDRTTQSIIYSLVKFNEVFYPEKSKGDYNVVARGATSLISKEVRGMQMDQLAQTLTDEEKLEIDNRKLLKERLATRDAEGLLLSETDAKIAKQARNRQMAEQAEMQKQMFEAEKRDLLSSSFKNITQGQKNQAAADAQSVTAALAVLENALASLNTQNDTGDQSEAAGGSSGSSAGNGAA